MERFESSVPKHNTQEKDAKKEDISLHFDELKVIERQIVSLVEQLKEQFERGEYDTLISDEAGGRVPTLILRKIMKMANPDAVPQTYFIAAGETLRSKKEHEREEYRKWLEEIASKTTRALVVSQFIYSGTSMANFARELHRAGIHHFDVATLIDNGYREEDLEASLGEDNRLFIGARDRSGLEEEHEKYGGVRTIAKDARPYPRTLEDAALQFGRDINVEVPFAVQDAIAGIEPYDSWEEKRRKRDDPKVWEEIERRLAVPFSDEEKAQIHEDVQKTREDIHTLAERVYATIWGNNR